MPSRTRGSTIQRQTAMKATVTSTMTKAVGQAMIGIDGHIERAVDVGDADQVVDAVEHPEGRENRQQADRRYGEQQQG